MKRFKVFKKICSLALILSMLVSMIPMNVFAAPTIDDITTKGSLTINKYDSDYTPDNPETPDKNEEVKKPINGVEFTIYKIYDLVLNNGVITYKPVAGLETFLNGVNPELIAEKNADDLKTFISSLKTKIENLNTDDNTANNIDKTSVTTGANGIDGQAVFSDLNLGYYLVDETAYPDQVVTPSNAFLVSIPMTNEAGDSWDYDVVANPKNKTALTNMTLTKYGNDNKPLQGAKFELQKKNGQNWSKYAEAVTDSNGVLTVDGLTQGTYQFVETEAPDDYILDTTKTYEFKVEWDATNEMLVYVYDDKNPSDSSNGDTSESLNIKVLNEKPIVDKTVDEPDFNIGDTVNWKITTTVPSIINELETFELIDTLSDELDFADSLNLVVKQDGTSLTAGTYTVSQDGRKLTITFDTSKLKPSKDIVVTYDTILNNNAKIAPDSNLNSVVLKYSSSTETGSTPITTDPETAKVYTFGLKVLKVNNSNEKLAGAVFTLYKGDGTTVIQSGLTTDTNGNIIVRGLDAGDYVLVETKAPKDYNLLKEPVKFTITAGYNENGELIPAEYKDGVLVQGPNKTNTVDGYYELTVVNKKGFQLPETGGMGTVIFTVVGLGMMGLAGAAYIALKRKESQQ